MKVYFEKFGEGCKVDYLTPMKLYEVVDRVGDVLVTIKDDVGDEILVAINGEELVGSPWKVSAESNNMKIYFEKFDDGHSASYLTPWKIYQVCGVYGDSSDCVRIKDDVGVVRNIHLDYDFHVFSSWKILPEETKTQSAADIVASLESERNALANSIDSVNELLDGLGVPKAETLVERVKSALTDAPGNVDRIGLKLVQVAIETESGEIVLIDAIPAKKVSVK